MSKYPQLDSGNFLKDRGYANPEETRTKFLLINDIELAYEDRGLPVSAEITGVDIDHMDARWTAAMCRKPISELQELLTKVRGLTQCLRT
ncbi:hypothetical protein [Mesorhizobium sp. A623]